MMGGSQTTEQSSTSTYTPAALSAMQGVVSGAQSLAANTNYNPATAKSVAGLTDYQKQGYSSIAGLQGRYDNTMQQAINTASDASKGLSTSDIQNYENPYTQDVINSTLASAKQSQGEQLANVVGNQISTNASGGSRAQLQKALTEGQFALANNQTISRLNQDNYNQATQTALSSNNQKLQAASGLNNYAQSGQNLDLSQYNALIGAGQQQQQQQQNVNDTSSANAKEQTMWPLQMQQWLSGIVGSIGSQEGGTTNGSSSSTTTQNPGVGQYLGMAASALAFLADGGAVQGGRRAAGGETSTDPWVALLQQPAHATAPQQPQLQQNAAAPAGPVGGDPAGDAKKGGQTVKDLAKGAKSVGSLLQNQLGDVGGAGSAGDAGGSGLGDAIQGFIAAMAGGGVVHAFEGSLRALGREHESWPYARVLLDLMHRHRRFDDGGAVGGDFSGPSDVLDERTLGALQDKALLQYPAVVTGAGDRPTDALLGVVAQHPAGRVVGSEPVPPAASSRESEDTGPESPSSQYDLDRGAARRAAAPKPEAPKPEAPKPEAPKPSFWGDILSDFRSEEPKRPEKNPLDVHRYMPWAAEAPESVREKPPATPLPAPGIAAVSGEPESASKAVQTFRVPAMPAGEPPKYPLAAPLSAENTPAVAPYAANTPAPKAEPDAVPGAPRSSMTARLNMEGNLGAVAHDTSNMPSVGRYGIHGVVGERNSSMAEFNDYIGRGLGFTADPVRDPWGYARQWQEFAKSKPQELQYAEDKWYQHFIQGSIAGHLMQVGMPKDIIDDPRVQDYMGDRLVQHGRGASESALARYREAWRSVKPDEQDKPAAFLRKLTDIDRSHTAYDFRTFIAQNVDRTPDIQQRLEKRVTNRLRGALGEGAQSAATGDETAGQKSAAELKPAELQHVGFLQKLVRGENPVAGWNPLEPITGPGPEGPTTGLSGLTGPQRERLLQFGLGMMQGPFLSDSAKGGLGALQHNQQYGLEQQKMGLEANKFLLEAAKAPKFAPIHSTNPLTGETQFAAMDTHTGQILQGPAAAQAVQSTANATQLIDQQAQKLVNGELRLSSLPAKTREPLLLRAQEIDPSWNPADEETRFKFRDAFLDPKAVTGKKARALEAATEHLGGAYDLIERTPSTGIVPLNRAANWYRENVGGDTALRDYGVKIQALSEELGKLMSESSGGAEAEKKRWLGLFDPAYTQEQRRAALASAIDAMEGQRHSLDNSWSQVMGPRAAGAWTGVSKKAQDIMDTVRQRSRAAMEQRYGAPTTAPVLGGGTTAAAGHTATTERPAGVSTVQLKEQAIQAMQAAQRANLPPETLQRTLAKIRADAEAMGVRF